MNNPSPEPLFSAIEPAPQDPILGITEAFNADISPQKVNLGVGVYYTDLGKVPLLKCVQKAEADIAKAQISKSYLPIDGLATYDKAVQTLIFGEGCPTLTEDRALTIQTLGGTGALKIGADFLKRFSQNAEVWISNPSWENHRAIFETAGFTVNTYPYYDDTTRGVNFDAMMRTLETLPANAVVLLHACCHNPTGADLSDEQWTEVIRTVQARQLIPFLDMAYQGFSEDIAKDGKVVQRFVETGMPLIISNSFSKSFSLYGERIGALSIVANSTQEKQSLLSQIKRLVRTNYSNPPRHGAQIVSNVLNSAELKQDWENELGEMRTRIQAMRKALADGLNARVPDQNFDYITQQNGMFSYSGLTKEQVKRLREEFSVYAIETGRICVAALNSQNIAHVIESIAKVV